MRIDLENPLASFSGTPLPSDGSLPPPSKDPSASIRPSFGRPCLERALPPRSIQKIQAGDFKEKIKGSGETCWQGRNKTSCTRRQQSGCTDKWLTESPLIRADNPLLSPTRRTNNVLRGYDVFQKFEYDFFLKIIKIFQPIKTVFFLFFPRRPTSIAQSMSPLICSFLYHCTSE